MVNLVKDMDFFDDIFYDIGDSEIEYDLDALSSEPYFEYDNKRFSCAFTGHRTISDIERKQLIPLLKSTVLYLVNLGVKEFRCGAATGFDTIAASVVYDISREHPGVKLILDLPYPDQCKGWSEQNKRFYDFIKSKAHIVNTHSKQPTNREEAVNALLLRNRIMVDASHYCICFLRDENLRRGGTSYTVNYAKLHDLQIINLFQQE